MSIQTTVKLEGTLNGVKKTAVITADQHPRTIFQDKTLKELFLLNIPNPGCQDINEEMISADIDIQRQCEFGIAGFHYTGNDMQIVLRKADELARKNEKELLDEATSVVDSELPDPEELLALATMALMEEDTRKAITIAEIFDASAKIALRGEEVKDVGGKFLIAAFMLAKEMIEGKGENT
ncbi:hypothetical protein [Desulfitobacterium hafniense]|uniref:hypothetical protein n=1 Tax=Desulfitobacterium hafniense TaxID=49338 RepID=UPI00037078F1|nr:hypothetical protein [Desulfitobacterium hafniense]